MTRGVLAPAAGFVHLDGAGREIFSGREDVASAAVAAHAKRQNGRMLEQQQRVADCSGAAIFDK